MTCNTESFKPGQTVILADTVNLGPGNWVGVSDIKDAAGNIVGTWDVSLTAPADPTVDPWGLVLTFVAGDPELLLYLLMQATAPLGKVSYDVKFMDNGGNTPHQTIYSETQYLILIPAITP